MRTLRTLLDITAAALAFAIVAIAAAIIALVEIVRDSFTRRRKFGDQ